MDNNAVLTIEALNKSFPGVKALNSIDMKLYAGEVHALLGENGAGKSTLVKIVSGVYKKDSGTIKLNDKEVSFSSPLDGFKNGISVIHQETSLIPQLTILENIFLGIEPNKYFPGFINREDMQKQFSEISKKIDFHFSPDTIVENLTVAEQKMVEIIKALVHQSSIIIMDEPTDALTDKEIIKLFSIIKNLKKNNSTILYITHYLEEVFIISDKLTVLKDGEKIDTVNTADINKKQLIQMMIGHEIRKQKTRDKQKGSTGSVVIEVENLSKGKFVKNISFIARQGEILGITGLLGAGKTELGRILFGADKKDSGQILINNIPVKINSPEQAIKHGICMLPDDRKNLGLFLDFEVYKNISMASLKSFSRRQVLHRKDEYHTCEKMKALLDIKITGPRQIVKNLSGGNQQKIVIAKWINANPNVFIMDEPTRGVDVNAKAEIYDLVKKIAEKGTCIIFISSEIPEIVEISDRIIVLKNGSIAAEFAGGASQNTIMKTLLEE